MTIIQRKFRALYRRLDGRHAPPPVQPLHPPRTIIFQEPEPLSREFSREVKNRTTWAIGILTFAAALTGLLMSPWPVITTLRHLAAAPDCAAARFVGLAPANRGEPGYYYRHDADDNGIACEPLPEGGGRF